MQADNILYAKVTSGCNRQEVRHLEILKQEFSSVAGMLKEPFRCSSYNATIRDKQQRVKQLFESIKIDTDHFKGSKKQRS
jgi:hypothetical protein